MKLTDLTDIQIWSSFKKGEEWAVSFIYKEYSEQLYYYGLKFSSNFYLIEDTLQDLFAELIKKRRTLGNTDNILYYLLKSFKRKLLRKINTEKRFVSDEGLEEYQFDVSWSAEHELILEEDSEKNRRCWYKH